MTYHGTTTLFLTLLFITTTALPPTQINSNSILVALLDSQYTELSELIEKALLLQTLEHALTQHNLTIFAPNNEALQHDLDPEFKRFLLEPRNLKSLQNLLLFHFIPSRIHSSHFHTKHKTLCNNHFLSLKTTRVSRPDHITRPDGLIHGIEKLLIPKSVQEDFNSRRNLRSISAVLPEGAPEIDPRTNRLKKPVLVNPGSPPVLPVYDALAPGPSLAPAPAPGPGGPRHHFDGESQVKDFIQTLLHYGGYNEMADILVNLTSLASEMGRLVSEGYVITVLAPNDEAMAKLTTDELSEPGAPEQIMYYHIIPEYQTEESMYNSVRRFGKVNYDTLRLPHKVVAEEADGSVKFGKGEASAYLFDPDIYTDGRISVQGIDGVLFPVEEEEIKPARKVPSGPNAVSKVASKPRRGNLLEVTCSMLGGFVHLSSCHSKLILKKYTEENITKSKKLHHGKLDIISTSFLHFGAGSFINSFFWTRHSLSGAVLGISEILRRRKIICVHIIFIWLHIDTVITLCVLKFVLVCMYDSSLIYSVSSMHIYTIITKVFFNSKSRSCVLFYVLSQHFASHSSLLLQSCSCMKFVRLHIFLKNLGHTIIKNEMLHLKCGPWSCGWLAPFHF